MLDEEGLTKAVIVRLSEQFSAGDSDKRGKQLDHVETWLINVVKRLQLAGRVSSKSFWAFYWSQDWYKWDFVARKPPDMADLEQSWNDLEKRIKSTSSSDMNTILADPTHLNPRDHPPGAFCAKAKFYVDDSSDTSKAPQEAHVIVDTGAQTTIISEDYVPKHVPVLNVPSVKLTGFGGGTEILNRQVQLRLRFLGKDDVQSFDIRTTAYVSEHNEAGIGVIVGTDFLHALGATVDVANRILRIAPAGEAAGEIPLTYLEEDGKYR